MTGFGKVSWQSVFGNSSAVSEAGVVTVVDLDSTSHCSQSACWYMSVRCSKSRPPLCDAHPVVVVVGSRATSFLCSRGKLTNAEDKFWETCKFGLISCRRYGSVLMGKVWLVVDVEEVETVRGSD